MKFATYKIDPRCVTCFDMRPPARNSLSVIDAPRYTAGADAKPWPPRCSSGTDVAMKVAGLVRATAVSTFGPLGTEDRFVTSSIPVAGSLEAGKEPRFVLTPIPSRVNLDVRTPTGVGAMRAFVEGDFAGSSRAFRLRHAYGQWKGLIVGQTWSTFADPEAEPDGIDFEGLNAIALFRQPLVRWTKPVGAGFSLAAAIENPAPDITNAQGVSQVPDLVVRARWEPPEGQKGPLGLMKVRQGVHVNLALLFRQLRGEPLGGDVVHEHTAALHALPGRALGAPGTMRIGGERLRALATVEGG